jgi:hypothetical protein
MIVSGWELCGILCAFEHTFWGEVIENNEFLNLNDNLKSKGELDKNEIHYNDVVDFIQRPMEVVWN